MPESPQTPAPRYERVRQLGRGGMAEVWLVRAARGGELSALKRLLVTRDAERNMRVALFESEYHTLTQLRHPNIVRAYDCGIDDEGQAYYTLELLEPRQQLAQGIYQLLTGNAAQAEATLREISSTSVGDGDSLRKLITRQMHALACVELGREESVRAALIQNMDEGDAWLHAGVNAAIIALCEARLGEAQAAMARVSSVLDALRRYELHGPFRALALQCAARAALHAVDATMFECVMEQLIPMSEGGRCPSLHARQASLLKAAQMQRLVLRKPSVIMKLEPDHEPVQPHAEWMRVIEQRLAACQVAEQRRQVVLEALAEQSAASAVHLYELYGWDLVHTCSAPASVPPPAELTATIEAKLEYWQRSLEDDATVTRANEQEHSDVIRTSASQHYRLVLLQSQPKRRTSAVIALALPEPSSPAPRRELCKLLRDVLAADALTSA